MVVIACRDLAFTTQYRAEDSPIVAACLVATHCCNVLSLIRYCKSLSHLPQTTLPREYQYQYMCMHVLHLMRIISSHPYH